MVLSGLKTLLETIRPLTTPASSDVPQSLIHPNFRRLRSGGVDRWKAQYLSELRRQLRAGLQVYEQHLGGKITMIMRRSEQPDQGAAWPGLEQSVQYASMELGETELMAADVPPDRFQPMCSAYLSLTVGSSDEAERIYALLSDCVSLHAHRGNVLRVPLRDFA